MKKHNRITYKKAGVDIQKAEDFIQSIKPMLKPKGKLSGLSAFACLYDLSKILKSCRKPVIVSSADGVGTKLKIAQALNTHSTIGIDLVAMNVNDIISCGE